MNQFNEQMLRMYIAITVPRRRDERGDVPGWVLITVMTAALVTLIYQAAKPQIKSLLNSALKGVN